MAFTTSFAASPLPVLDSVSDGQSPQLLMHSATLQIDSYDPEHSDRSVESTAAGDTESECLESPRDIYPLMGRVLSLSCSPDGCRQVQDALGKVVSDKERELLVNEFHGHAITAMRCPHANHVLQKCISVMPPASLQFMIDEMLQHQGLAKKVATHRYGTRIVQQLLKKCEASQLSGLAEALLQDAIALSCHGFGCFAIQHLLQFGTAEQQYRCVRTLEQNMGSIARSPCGVGVVAAAMKRACNEDKVWIARALLQDPKLLPSMAQMRYGEEVVPQVLSALVGKERVQAFRSLADASSELLSARYGRKVHAYLQVRMSGDMSANSFSISC